jgi:hypothetical protein
MSLSITSATFDQAVYDPGDTITLTVDYSSTDSAPADVISTVTVTATDASGTATSPATLTVAGGSQQAEPVTVSASDSRVPSGTWTVISNTVSGTGPFTGVAVLTSLA